LGSFKAVSLLFVSFFVSLLFVSFFVSLLFVSFFVSLLFVGFLFVGLLACDTGLAAAVWAVCYSQRLLH
jgi:hypothetical protein